MRRARPDNHRQVHEGTGGDEDPDVVEVAPSSVTNAAFSAAGSNSRPSKRANSSAFAPSVHAPNGRKQGDSRPPKVVNPMATGELPVDVVQGMVETALANLAAGEDADQAKATPKFSSDAVKATAEMLKFFVQEATLRAKHQMEEDNDQNATTVEPAHLSKILPTLLLDM